MGHKWWVDAVAQIAVAAINEGLIKTPYELHDWINAATRDLTEADLDYRRENPLTHNKSYA